MKSLTWRTWRICWRMWSKRLKSPEEENARLKKLLAEAMLDKEALQVALGRKF